MRLLLYFFLFFISTSISAQKYSKRKIARVLKKISVFEKAHIAFSVESLNESSPLASFQDEKYMTPASNTKLLTFLAAIQNFDSIPSVFFYQEKDSIMHFKSSGYPLLFHHLYPDDSLASFFMKKKSWLYHPPNSRLKRQGPGWSWDDYFYYFAAESSSFPIYGNSVQASFNYKGPQLFPRSFEKRLVSDTIVSGFERDRVRNIFYYNPKNASIKDTLYLPFITSDSLFVTLLQEKINYPVELSDSDEHVPWQALHTNQESIIYRALLKDSDNGIAESLLTMISQKRFDEMNIEKTIDSIKRGWNLWLPDHLEWFDGSGVSRYNMLTPRTLIAVLKKIHETLGWKKINTYFPKTGISGTLKAYKRLREVYAKTGTLRHNHNLSGYWKSTKGNVYVFSIMVNHFTAPKEEIRLGISELLEFFQKKLR